MQLPALRPPGLYSAGLPGSETRPFASAFPEVLFAACDLGVFDLLAQAPEPLTAAAVAAGLGTSCSGTGLLLDACVTLRLLAVETRAGQAVYANTALSSTYLVRASPTSQLDMLRYLGGTTYVCWAHLADAVRWAGAGGTRGHPRTANTRSEDERLRFMRGLQDVWRVHGRRLMATFDLSPFPLICDVGGDFFKDPLPEADLYILARVLHDWADEACLRLLARVHQACRPGGGVLVIESLLDADGRGPLRTQLYSLNMLVQTEGRERTRVQYCALLAAAGFRHVQGGAARSSYDAILARK
ncbi:PREDICTED: acetylserotonin O-methyltransferase [Condylura cristata]|uniref:acetylserotonin O-methyltransferase n=1 Tax=Condylura cristata TaxID=143302 RepID=UPI000643409E|nr:PREDICTED: acetylserotonin O-methyltransferase [Condylura cristata]